MNFKFVGGVFPYFFGMGVMSFFRMPVRFCISFHCEVTARVVEGARVQAAVTCSPFRHRYDTVIW